VNVFFLVSIATFLTFFLGDFPGWFDSGQLALGIQTLGVTHAPGQPIYVLIGKVFALFPFGSIAFRTSLLSAFCCAGIALCISFLISTLLRNLQDCEKASLFKATFYLPSMFFLLHPSIGLQATRTEVYAFMLLLTLLNLVFLILAHQTQDARHYFSASFSLGLSLGVHPVMGLAFLPGFILMILCFQKSQRVRLFFQTTIWIGIGLMIYVYLPLRASTQPLLNWDDPVNFRRFFAFITAKDFQSSFHKVSQYSAASSAASIVQFLDTWTKLFSVPSMLLAFWGVVTLFYRGKRIVAGLLLLLLISSFSPWITLNFVLGNPDVHGYASPSLALLFVLASIGAINLFQRLPVRQEISYILGSLLCLSTLYKPISGGVATFAAHGGEDAEILSRYLDHAPQAGSIFVASDHWLFPLWYRSYIEGRRPDVKIVGEGLLPASWYRRQINKKYRYPFPSGDKWVEKAKFNSGEKEQFLGHEGQLNSLRDLFVEKCREQKKPDYFSIKKTVCGFIVWQWTEQMVQFGDIDHAIQLLEDSINTPRSQASCPKIRPIEIPYPLSRDYADPFLIEADRLESELMLTYLGCGHLGLASNLFAQKSQSLDVLLLYAALLWHHGNQQKAFEVLNLQMDLTRGKSGVLALAKATFFWMARHEDQAKKEIKIAKDILGKNDRGVLQLEKHLMDH